MPARVLLLALALALVGCKKKEAAPAGGSAASDVATGPMDPLVAEVHDGLKKFRTRMCECKDVRCADQVQMELGGWIMSNKDRFAEIDQKSTPAQIAAAKKISAEHNECAGKVVQQQK